MVALGRPGVGEAFLAERGFDVAERFEVSLVLEFADAELYARGVASSGPAYESIQSIGEEQFRVRAEELATGYAVTVSRYAASSRSLVTWQQSGDRLARRFEREFAAGSAARLVTHSRPHYSRWRVPASEGHVYVVHARRATATRPTSG